VTRRVAAATAAFAALIACFYVAGKYFGVASRVEGHLVSTLASLSLALAPYWAFGFGLDGFLRATLKSRVARVAAPAALILPYFVFALPRGDFRWDLCAGMTAIFILIPVLLDTEAHAPCWRDWAALALLGIAVDLHVFDKAWPVPGLSGVPKLLFVDAGLYGYLVIRPIGGIGFDFTPRMADFRNGLREFLFFTPIALAFGLGTGFLHVHRTLASPLWFGSGWLFTFFFVAMPEELFFRGLMLNLMERRMGTRRAVAASSLLFGLAHFNKRAAGFNWRYVILAAIAGVFYARAWLSERRLPASSITHATVDTVWSIWLR
jgi:hypothetical protein